MPDSSIALAVYLAAAARGWTRLQASLGLPQLRDADFPDEPLGRYEAAPPREDGPLLWIHAGRAGALGPIAELTMSMSDLRPELNFLITVSDAEDRRRDMAGFAPTAALAYTPDDTLAAVTGFLDHWRPDVAVWMGATLRPALIVETHARGIPIFAMDGPRAVPGARPWRQAPGMRRALLRRFNRTLAGDSASYERHLHNGVPSWALEEVGFLEEGAVALPCDEAERADLSAALAARPVWLAMMPDPSEEADILTAHLAALRKFHRLLLILVPDDPARAGALRDAAEALGLDTALRTELAAPDSDCQVFIADASEDPGLWYRLATVTFMGQTFSGGPGRNPYEPAALGSAVVHGGQIGAWRGPYGRLAGAGAAVSVGNRAELVQAIEMLQAPDKVAMMAHAAWEVCSSGAEVSDRITRLVFDALDMREAKDAPA